MSEKNRYSQIIERIFFAYFKEGITEFEFEREEFRIAADALGLRAPDNLGDITYTYRYRQPLPEKIRETTPVGMEWIIMGAGIGRYRFVLAPKFELSPTTNLVETKILDATPGIITKYALGDEQALLAIVRFNRLIDIFTGLTCYSLQNHLRTTVPEMGQVEVDEIYIGIDKRGSHYIIPVQAKGHGDNLGIVQIEQDFALAAAKFPSLKCKSVAAQFMNNGAIALFEMELNNEKVEISSEKHYRLVSSDELSQEELASYSNRSFN
ncbi:MAG: endonuclease [Blastocatellia bacterium]